LMHASTLNVLQILVIFFQCLGYIIVVVVSVSCAPASVVHVGFILLLFI
jgi:hypothetical protein